MSNMTSLHRCELRNLKTFADGRGGEGCVVFFRWEICIEGRLGGEKEVGCSFSVGRLWFENGTGYGGGGWGEVIL